MIEKYKDGIYTRGELSVVTTVDYKDGRGRIHMSASCQNRLPTWEEMKRLREELLPLNRDFVMFFPNQKDYVNIHPYCLHLLELKPNDNITEFIDRKEKIWDAQVMGEWCNGEV